MLCACTTHRGAYECDDPYGQKSCPVRSVNILERAGVSENSPMIQEMCITSTNSYILHLLKLSHFWHYLVSTTGYLKFSSHFWPMVELLSPSSKSKAYYLHDHWQNKFQKRSLKAHI